MKYAASLGVATRKQGTKLWRAVSDVREDCKLREAAQQQRSRAHAGEPGSASSSLAVPSASRGLAPTQTSSAHAGEPGSANSSQAQVAPSASGRVAEKPVPRAEDIAACDLRNMSKSDLRKLAAKLRVVYRRATVSDLRAACSRALQGQSAITGFFEPGVASQGDLGPEVAGQVAGVAPVSDSASAVEPNQTKGHKRRRGVGCTP